MPLSCNVEDDLLELDQVDTDTGLGRTRTRFSSDVFSPRLVWIGTVFELHALNLGHICLARYRELPANV